MNSLSYEVYDADSFFVMIDDAAPDVVEDAVRKQLDHYRRTRPREDVDLPERLRAARAPHFAERVDRHVRSIESGR